MEISLRHDQTTESATPAQPAWDDLAARLYHAAKPLAHPQHFALLNDRQRGVWISTAKMRAEILARHAQETLVPTMGQGGPWEERHVLAHALVAAELLDVRQEGSFAPSRFDGMDEVEAPLTLSCDLASTKAQALADVRFSDLPFSFEEVKRAAVVVVNDGERERFLKDRTGLHRDDLAAPDVPEAFDHPWLEDFERRRASRIAWQGPARPLWRAPAGALIGAAAAFAALYAIFWALEPGTGAVIIVAAWLVFCAVIGGLVATRRP